MSGVWPRVVPGVGGGISQTPTPGQSTSQHYTVHSTQYRMIVQDISDMRDTDEQTMIVTGEFLTKMNYLLVLMGVIFTLLCLLLTVCVIM